MRVSVAKVSRLVSEATGLETLNIAKKRYSKISIIQRFYVCCICRKETIKTGRRNAKNPEISRNLKKVQLRSDDDKFLNLAKCTNFEVSSLGLELQVPNLGIFDEVSVSVSKF